MIKRQELVSALIRLSDVIINSINSADRFVGIIVFIATVRYSFSHFDKDHLVPD